VIAAGRLSRADYGRACSAAEIGSPSTRGDYARVGAGPRFRPALHGRSTLRDMLERTQVRALPVINRGVDLAPAVQACCGACRTCVTSNILGVLTAAVGGAAFGVTNFAKRRFVKAS